MKRFWCYQVRYRAARFLVHLGLKIMPPGRAKAEIMEMLWEWRWHVENTVSAAKHVDGSPTSPTSPA